MYAVYVIFIFVFKVCYGWQYKDGKLFYANCTQDKEKLPLSTTKKWDLMSNLLGWRSLFCNYKRLKSSRKICYD